MPSMDDLQLQSGNGKLGACDGCHAKKIKCDRGCPCGNCRDADLKCLRERLKPPRKPKVFSLDNRDSTVSEVSAALDTLKARIARLEETTARCHHSGLDKGDRPSRWMRRSLSQSSVHLDGVSPGIDGDLPSSKRRKRAKGHAGSSSPGAVSLGPRWLSQKSSDVDDLNAPHSAMDGRDLIQDQLRFNKGISARQSQSLRSALATLNEALKSKASMDQSHCEDLHFWSCAESELAMGDWTTPPLATVQWMLTTTKAVDALWSLPDGLPMVSRKSLAAMALAVSSQPKHPQHPAFVVCVNSSVAYFLLEYMTACKTTTGLEGQLQDEVAAYFSTARSALARIGPSCAPSLATLQALVYGSVNAQELGNFEQSWQYTAAACSMCIALGLHRGNDSSPSPSCSGSTSEARYCLFASYILDKGLAMNLGRPPCLPDEYIEVDLRLIAVPSEPTLRQVLQNYYLELAIAQSGIVSPRMANARAANTDKIKYVLGVLDGAWSMIKDLPERHRHELPWNDLEYEHRMAKFSHHSIRTVFHHLCSRDHPLPELGDGAALRSARAAMSEFQDLLGLFRRAEFDSFRLNSFAHCIVLYYPFTSYFVLFCHVVVTGNAKDFQLMDEFVDYLAKLKDSSAPFGKLHTLCLPFRSLAAFAVNGTHEAQSQSLQKDSAFLKPNPKAPSPQDTHALPNPHAEPAHVPLVKDPPQPALTDLAVPAACPPTLNGAAPNSLDFADFGLDTLSGGLFQDLLQEQPSLDWLEWDLPMPTFEEGM